MERNYLFLKHIAEEIGKVVRNAVIVELYSQEKETAVMLLDMEREADFNALKFSVSPRFPFVIPEEAARKLRNSADVLPRLKGLKIENTKIVSGERVIEFDLSDGGKLYFSAIPGRTNLTYVNRDKKAAFKSSGEFKPEDFPPYNCLETLKKESKRITPETPLNKIVPFCRILNKRVHEIALISYRKEAEAGDFVSYLSGIIQKAEKSGEYHIYYDENSYDYLLTLIPHPEPPFSGHRKYGSAVAALKEILYFFRFRRELLRQKEEILTKLKAKRENLLRRKAKLDAVKLSEKDKERYSRYADLIKANIYRLKKGMEKAALEDFFSEKMEKISIPLKKNLTPEENARYYYHRIKAYDENRKELEYRKKVTAEKLAEIELKIKMLDSAENFKALKKTVWSMKSKNDKKSAPEKRGELKGIREYVTPDGWRILVGKDDESNDRLTFRIGKNKDIWMHAHGVPGSHVLIVNRDKKQDVPKDIIKEAASYAAFFSKAKNAGTVPVIYTEVRYVRKPRGAKPGSVTCQREKTIFVSPRSMP
jgi:predicted ribosome quality control (RQC) complex YloA/Tae2 family protein